MKHYMMIVRGSHGLSEAEIEQRKHLIDEWTNLARSALSKLDPRMATRCVSSIAFSNGALISAPEPEDPEISVIIHFDAERDDEAALIAGLHPALRFGARIELREWAALEFPR